jgi:hypothetical protein
MHAGWHNGFGRTGFSLSALGFSETDFYSAVEIKS